MKNRSWIILICRDISKSFVTLLYLVVPKFLDLYQLFLRSHCRTLFSHLTKFSYLFVFIYYCWLFLILRLSRESLLLQLCNVIGKMQNLIFSWNSSISYRIFIVYISYTLLPWFCHSTHIDDMETRSILHCESEGNAYMRSRGFSGLILQHGFLLLLVSTKREENMEIVSNREGREISKKLSNNIKVCSIYRDRLSSFNFVHEEKFCKNLARELQFPIADMYSLSFFFFNKNFHKKEDPPIIWKE